MSNPSNIEPFVLIGRNGLQTSIALQHLINAKFFPRSVWIQSIETPLPALTERICRAHQLSYHYVSDLNDLPTVQRLLRIKPEFAIVAGLGTILNESLLDQILIANLHIGTLPLYRGAHVNFWKMKNGDDWYGATIHKMEKTIDRGDIFAIAELDASQIIDGFELMRQNYHLAGELLLEWMGRDDKWERKHPNADLHEPGKYYPKFSEADFQLDVTSSVTHLYKQINRLRFYGDSKLHIGEQSYSSSRADLLSEEYMQTDSISIKLVRENYAILNHPTGLLGLHLNKTT